MATLETVLEEKKRSLRDLRDRITVASTVAVVLYDLSRLIGFLGLCGAFCGPLGGFVDRGLGSWDGWGEVFWGGLALAVIGFVTSDTIEKRFKNPEETALEVEISRLGDQIREIADTTKELSAVEESLSIQEPQRYGCQSTGGLQSLQTERRELIKRILGEFQPVLSFSGIAPNDQDQETAHPESQRRSCIFGYAAELTGEFGHGHPLPAQADPVREWVATLWEHKLGETILEVDVPALASTAEAQKWAKKMLKKKSCLDAAQLRSLTDTIVEIRTVWSSEDLAEHFDRFLTKGAVILCVVEGEVNVFTKELGVRFPSEFLRKCREMLKIRPEQPVAWYQNLNSVPLKTVARYALYGVTPPETPNLIANGGKLTAVRNGLRAQVIPTQPQ